MKNIVSKFNHLFHAPTLITFIVAGFVIAGIVQAAVSTNSPPSGELIIPTNKSTNLNSSFLRMTKIVVILDDDISKWRGSGNWEAWSTNSGKAKVIDRGEIELNAGQLKNLFSDGSPKQALRILVLQDSGLTAKP